MFKKSLLILSFLVIQLAAYAQDDLPETAKTINATLLAEITAQGQKVNAVALEYEGNLLSGSDLRKTYQIFTTLEGKEQTPRTILRSYVNDKPETSAQSKAGKFVIIELDDQDKNADLYSLKTENDQPMKFKGKDKDGNIVEIEKKQATKVPQYYGEKLVYQINQTGYLKLMTGKTLAPISISQAATHDKVKTLWLDEFQAKSVFLNDKTNVLNYRIFTPHFEQGKAYPLTIFLHGSGQVGSDNLAHLLSSKGAISTLQYEQGVVLAPQYQTVFDPFDKQGGIHWQTNNRRDLVLKMIDDTLAQYPQIDKNRIYLVGLSRGAEGSVKLLLNQPHFFAAALLMSGREAYTHEWADGNATKENLAPIKNIPMWFFHSKEDNISPVKGSRINVKILTEELQAPNVKYTEFTMENIGDNGIVNNNAHNTWDAVFNSPEVMQWLVQQKRK
ncbi:TPA: phospholipase [Haemophilus influenzae]